MFLNSLIKDRDVIRNIDMAALRAFVTVAEAGGVTRAAGFLNLTQSAVSMQIKRLEEMLGQSLFDRVGRGMSLTAEGDQLLTYGRRMVAINDEAVARMTGAAYEGELILGVPHDIVYPHIPNVLRRFAEAYPRVKVQLKSSFTRPLMDRYRRGECDMILTTETSCGPEGETLARLPLIWVGAPGGVRWRQQPVRLAFEENCLFRSSAQNALDQAGMAWELAVQSRSSRTVEATISADLAIHVCLDGCGPPHVEPIEHNGALPDLPEMNINLYAPDPTANPLAARLVRQVRMSYGAG